MAHDPATIEYHHWINAVRQTPACLLQLDFTVAKSIQIDRFPGSKLNGALWAGLRHLADHHCSAEMRSSARRALQHHDRRENSAGYRERPLVLGLPFAPMHLSSGEAYSLCLVLFGEIVPTWPAWIEAAMHLHLKPGVLELADYTAFGPDGAVVRPGPDQDTAVRTKLGSLNGPIVAQDYSGAWLLRVETPLVLDMKSRRVFDLPNLEPLVVSALSSLGAVADRRPGRDNTALLRSLGAATVPLERSFEPVHALYHNHAGKHGYHVRGIMGHAVYAQLPLQVREVLTLARFTHLGQHSAFGLGRISLLPLEL